MWISGISLTAATIFCPQRAVWISNVCTQRVWKEFFHPVVHSESFQLPQANVDKFSGGDAPAGNTGLQNVRIRNASKNSPTGRWFPLGV